MRYRIDYADGSRSRFVDGSRELIAQLEKERHGAVEDVRKVFKSGVTDSVVETYRKYLA